MKEFKKAGDKVTIEDVYESCKRYITNEDDMKLIKKAYDYIMVKHEGQKRKSGEPYTIHLIWVAYILSTLQTGPLTITAGLLHDVMEDCDVSREEMVKEFGEEVTTLVEGVTKISKMPFKDEADVYAENHRKIYIAMAKDIRVILIKFADRLHNMRTLQFMPPEKQKRISRETLEVYTPIAHRLGLSDIKTELEDRSLSYLDPIAYHDIARLLQTKQDERKESVAKMMEEVENLLKENHYQYRILGRAKSIYSIYKKMFKKHKRFDELYDLYALRIILQNKLDCYSVLGLIHDHYRPIPGRFKDYIAMPKPNNYQSLHTTLIASNGQPFEIQIRTYEMHKIAEYGIAAHWKYKEGKTGEKDNQSEEAKLSWLRQILEWQKEMSDNKEFLSSIKNDLNLFSDSVYCFTPTGDVKNLPAGSCPIDFAYSIHSAVGNKMVGARVNGKLVTIDYVIKNGDRIEIITSQNSKGPSRDWLSIVKSTQAKNKINQWFKQELKEDNIIKGKEMVANYCKTKGIVLSDITKPEYVEKCLNKYGFKDWDSILAAVGHGALKESQIVNRLNEEHLKTKKAEVTDKDVLEEIVAAESKEKAKKKEGKGGIVVKGIHDVAVRFSKCCNPVPGDEIVGFVTRGRGISIHRTDCVNIINFPANERARLIEAEWEQGQTAGDTYEVEINIFANNRTGLIVDISRMFTEAEIDVKSMNCRLNKKEFATISVGFDIHGKEELNRIIDKLRKIDGVTDITRTAG